MNSLARITLIAGLTLVVGALAPVAGAAPKLTGGVTLKPITPGNLWKTGVLYGATMYAQIGNQTIAKVNPISVPGAVVSGLPTITTYACDATSTTVAPALRAKATKTQPATCTLMASKKAIENTTIELNVPAPSTGKYLSVMETATLLRKGARSTGVTWVETPIYPANPITAGPAVSTAPTFAGGPTTYLPLPWVLARTTTLLAYSSQAWICPNKIANNSAEALSTIGCNRTYKNINTTTTSTTFTLGGRVHHELTQGQYLYYVSFVTVEPDGPLAPQTYEVRGKAILIKPLPAPHPAYSTANTVITATFNPIDGVTYKMSANRVGSHRQFAAPCLGDLTQIVCTLDVLPGQWRMYVTPIGKQAVGTAATTILTVAAAPAP